MGAQAPTPSGTPRDRHVLDMGVGTAQFKPTAKAPGLPALKSWDAARSFFRLLDSGVPFSPSGSLIPLERRSECCVYLERARGVVRRLLLYLLAHLKDKIKPSGTPKDRPTAGLFGRASGWPFPARPAARPPISPSLQLHPFQLTAGLASSAFSPPPARPPAL